MWEELHSPQYLQTLFYSLRKTLRGIGFEDLLIRTRNHTSIDVSKLHCDLYEFLKGSRRRRKQLRRRVHEQLQLGRV